MKPEVWIVNQYAVTPEYPASTRHYEMAKCLADTFHVTLWGSNFIHHTKTFRSRRMFRSFRNKIDGFKMIWVPALPYKNNGWFRMLNIVLYACVFFLQGMLETKKPQVVIGSSPPLLAAFGAMLVARSRGSKFILEIRDLWPDTYIEMTGRTGGVAVSILRWMENVLYRNADLVIGLSIGIVETIKRRGVPEEKARFLPNGIDMKSFEEQPSRREEIRRNIGITEKHRVFLYAGSHGPANDLGQLIEAAEHFRNDPLIAFVLIGEGVEKKQLQRQVASLQLSNVIFLPSVPKFEIGHYLSCADVFIICLKNIPLFEFAFPNKLFDYLLQNKPIVTTVSGEIKVFLEKWGLGMFANMKGEGECYLPNALLKASDLPEPNIRGSDLVKMHFSREAQMVELERSIRDLINQ